MVILHLGLILESLPIGKLKTTLVEGIHCPGLMGMTAGSEHWRELKSGFFFCMWEPFKTTGGHTMGE